MNPHLRKIWDTLKASYWFVPLIMMAAAALLWVGTGTLDYHLSTREKKTIAWLYISDSDSMRNVLLTIAAAIVGIVGVVFSIIMVPLSIAASQFGPRLLRTFLRDTGTQVTLGTFTSTFIFCMLVLLHLSSKSGDPLPQISVNVALLLGLASFGILLYFINHVAESIQAPLLVATVSRDLQAAIKRELPDQRLDSASYSSDAVIAFDTTASHQVVAASKSGYVQTRDDKVLLKLAAKHGLTLQLLASPGDFVVQGTPIALAWPPSLPQHLPKMINAAFIHGSRRTLVQDITFGVNELVEVALRALSPAINDPFTAMTCLDWLGSALCFIITRPFPPAILYEVNGAVRIIRKPITFTSMAAAAFNQIREYGRNSSAVTLRLMETIKVVSFCAKTSEQRATLLHHAKLTESASQINLPEETDRKLILTCYQQVKELLQREAE